MKQKTLWTSIALAASTMLTQSQVLQQVSSVPRSGTFWSMQLTNRPPLPFLPNWLPEGTPVYLWSSNAVYVYDDRNVDYRALNEMTQSAVTYPPSPWDGDYDGFDTNSYPPGPLGQNWGPNDLWLEIQRDPYDTSLADLILHGTTTGLYQWAATTDLAVPFGVPFWVPGQVLTDSDGTNTLYFTPVRCTLPKRFFRAIKGDTKVSVTWDGYYAEEPCSPTEPSQVGVFEIAVNPPVNRELTIVYLISGSAENGIDYTNLSGSLVLPTNTSSAQIYVHATNDSLFEFEESVKISLVVTNGYLIDPANASATCFIRDCTTNLFTVVATNVPSPVGIDYHEPTRSLILSLNYQTDGSPNNFARLDTNGVLSQWSTIAGLHDEVKFAIPKETRNGFTNGSLYFGRDTDVGYLSSNASIANLTWCTLTNDTVTNASYLRGSLCFDDTGVWSNQLIAVTSNTDPDETQKGLWRINAQGQPSLVTSIPTWHLEGLITITNDRVKWGPWAGKILTGDESARDENEKPAPVVYAVDTAGVTRGDTLDIQPEDFDIVPTNQNLYCVRYKNEDSTILKLSKTVLNDYVGDLVITQAGEHNPLGLKEWKPKLFFVHWSGSNFITRSITLPYANCSFEHVTFAPIELPNIPE